MSQNWDCFLWSADEWIVNYSLPPCMIGTKLFSIGHALELYLKAAYSKMTGNVDEAINFRHDIKGLWEACKNKDSKFLPKYELRKSVISQDILGGAIDKVLSRDDFAHFLKHQELYVVAKHLVDLKYFGAPLKSIKGAYSLGFVFTNPLWEDLFVELRQYMGHPEKGKLDVLRHHLEDSNLPVSATEFLKKIVR
jgi:hypothetical protein